MPIAARPTVEEEIDLGYFASQPYPCPYLAGRVAKSLCLMERDNYSGEVVRLSDQVFQRLMEAGLVRVGRMLLVPTCAHCRECVSLRIDVRAFAASKGQRRVWRRNQDVELRVCEPSFSNEKLDLYVRYVGVRHPHQGTESVESFRRMYVVHFGNTRQFCYYLDGRLVAMGVVDLLPDGAVSSQFCFDPELSQRRLGTYSILREIQHCQSSGRRYLYLGYRVSDCRFMSYKSAFRPHQLLHPTMGWVEEKDWR